MLIRLRDDIKASEALEVGARALDTLGVQYRMGEAWLDIRRQDLTYPVTLRFSQENHSLTLGRNFRWDVVFAALGLSLLPFLYQWWHPALAVVTATSVFIGVYSIAATALRIRAITWFTTPRNPGRLAFYADIFANRVLFHLVRLFRKPWLYLPGPYRHGSTKHNPSSRTGHSRRPQ